MPTISTNTGKGAIAEKIGGLGSTGDFTYLHLGSNGTAATTADTQLGAEFTDSGLEAALATVSTDAANTLQLTHRFTAAAAKVIKETGVFEPSASVPDPTLVEATVSNIAEVSYEVGDNGINTLTRDSQGNLYALVRYPDLASAALVKSTDDGTTWSEVGTYVVDNDTSHTLCIDGQDRILIIYTLDANETVNSIICVSDVLGTPEVVATPVTNAILSACSFVGADGKFHVLYSYNAFGADLGYSYYDMASPGWVAGNNYTAPGTTSYVGHIQLVYDAASNLAHMIMNYYADGVHAGPNYMTFSYADGGTYGAPELVGIGAAAGAGTPRITIEQDQDGFIHMAWANPFDIYYTNDKTGSFATPAIIETPAETTATYTDSVVLRRSKDGSLHLVYSVVGTPSWFCHKEFDGSSWGTTETLVTGDNNDIWIYCHGATFAQFSYQIPDKGYEFIYCLGINDPYTESMEYYGYASFASSGGGSIMLSRSTFNDIYVDTGDSVTITTKIAIN